MYNYFRDFPIGVIQYRAKWIDVQKGTNVARLWDDEAMNVFFRLGWTPVTVGYVRLFGGQVDTGLEATMSFAEYDDTRPSKVLRVGRTE